MTALDPSRVDVDRLERVIALIEADEKLFDYDLYWTGTRTPDGWREPDCGTTGCLAGWATHLALNDPDFDYPPMFLGFSMGRAYLGLSADDATCVFEGELPLLYEIMAEETDGSSQQAQTTYFAERPADVIRAVRDYLAVPS